MKRFIPFLAAILISPVTYSDIDPVQQCVAIANSKIQNLLQLDGRNGNAWLAGVWAGGGSVEKFCATNPMWFLQIPEPHRRTTSNCTVMGNSITCESQ
jgi:hypothetical protein